MDTTEKIFARNIDTNQIWDWIVIGTGMGGATFGHALAKAGRQVLFIEKGANHRANRQKKTGDYLECLVSRPSARNDDDYKNAGRSSLKIRDATRRRWLKPILGSGTGGSSALFGMVMERFWKEDFEAGRWHVNSDCSLPSHWPVSFEEMEPYYKEAERLFGVSSAGTDPLRKEQIFNHVSRPSLSAEGNQLLARLRAKGLHPYSLPLARQWGSSCPFCQSFLCGHDCKNDAAKICLEPSLQSHGSSLLAEAEVLEITAEATRVTGVKVRIGNQIKQILANNVALAAGALMSPALLLKSRSSHHPQGLANRSGQVGRNLMRHYIDLLGIPTTPHSGDQGDQKELALNDLYYFQGKKFGTLADFGKMPPLPVVMEDMDHEMSSKSTLLKSIWWFLRPLAGWILGQLLSRHRFLALITEDLPFENNRVEIGTDGADLTIYYSIHPQEKTRISQARSLARKLLKINRLIVLPNADNTKLIAHACGTCRMGDDPTTSVVNRYNRAHDLENLYIVDASFFPSSGGANPALTIAANALRVAQHVLKSSEENQVRQDPGTPLEKLIEKKTILFMPGSFSLAHVGRLVTLAKALPESKFSVVFACDKHSRPFIPARFSFQPATFLHPDEFRQRMEKGHPLIDAPLLRRQIEEDLQIIRKTGADLVVGDFRPSLSVSARLSGVPYINVFNAHWSPWAQEPIEVSSPPDHWFLNLIGRRLGLKLTNTLFPIIKAIHSQPFNRVRKEYGLPSLGNRLKEIYSDGDYTALTDLSDIVPTPGAPGTQRSIGPVIWEPESDLPSWWNDLPNDKPLIYVTLGSSGKTNCLPKILESLDSLPVVVAVATAGRISVTPIPGKRYVADYLPGSLLCKRASVVVNNGGAGGVYQALAEGVPVLGVAANLDQCLVMKTVVRAGAGRLVLADQTETCPWRNHFLDLLFTKSIKAAAVKISALINQQSAPQNFCNQVQSILDRSKTSHADHDHTATKEPL
jgi:choline dehydrogenase-like flavoprotein/UDP:flavonoid glycosyltransferase YjiC (YdhE family)